MRVSEVLGEIYKLIDANRPQGVKRVFDPGKPVVYRQNMPAVVIQPDSPTKEVELSASDVKTSVVSAEIHVLTEGSLVSQEQRSRGDMSQAMEIADAIEEILDGNPDLGGTVEDLVRLSVTHLSPAHSWVSATYSVREAREKR